MSEFHESLSDLKTWLQAMERRLQEMGAGIGAEDPHKQFNELMDLSKLFLSLSQSLLAMGKTASRAAEAVLQQAENQSPPETNPSGPPELPEA